MSNKKEKNTIIKDTISLCAITLIAGLALGFVNDLTAGPIQARKDAEKQAAYGAVYSNVSFGENSEYADVAETSTDLLAAAGITNVRIDEVLEAKNGDEVVGHVMQITSSEGYGGEVPITIGIANDGTIQAIEVLANGETSGFGSRASEPEFKNQFKNKKADSIEFVKGGGASGDNQINAITGATKTTTAVTKCVNAGLYYVKNNISK